MSTPRTMRERALKVAQAQQAPADLQFSSLKILITKAYGKKESSEFKYETGLQVNKIIFPDGSTITTPRGASTHLLRQIYNKHANTLNAKKQRQYKLL